MSWQDDPWLLTTFFEEKFEGWCLFDQTTLLSTSLSSNGQTLHVYLLSLQTEVSQGPKDLPLITHLFSIKYHWKVSSGEGSEKANRKTKRSLGLSPQFSTDWPSVTQTQPNHFIKGPVALHLEVGRRLLLPPSRVVLQVLTTLAGLQPTSYTLGGFLPGSQPTLSLHMGV